MKPGSILKPISYLEKQESDALFILIGYIESHIDLIDTKLIPKMNFSSGRVCALYSIEISKILLIPYDMITHFKEIK